MMFDNEKEEPIWHTIQDGEFTMREQEIVIESTKDAKVVQKVIDDISYRMKSVPFRNENRRIGRNEICPCGSNMKFKKCCLELKR